MTVVKLKVIIIWLLWTYMLDKNINIEKSAVELSLKTVYLSF